MKITKVTLTLEDGKQHHLEFNPQQKTEFKTFKGLCILPQDHHGFDQSIPNQNFVFVLSSIQPEKVEDFKKNLSFIQDLINT